MSKKLWVILGSVAIVVIAAIVIAFSYTYRANGVVTDISTKTPVANVAVSIANHKATTSSTGSYLVTGIKFWEKKPLQVTAPSAYISPSQVVLTYSSRSITKDFTLEPTLQTMVDLVDTAQVNRQYNYLWDFMQPDSQTSWGDKATYTSLMTTAYNYYQSINQTSKDFKISGTIITLPSWTDPITGKTFQNVYEVPVSYTEVDNGQSTPKTLLTYYQEVGGFYHYFTQAKKDDAQKAVDAIKALSN
ncbi:MAG: hypothetical protein NTY30_00090 [Candidatus Berkelbacteria bacterium]|nr:hypothetical protein [Candidatus Berkelbacteria bacterium]